LSYLSFTLFLLQYYSLLPISRLMNKHATCATPRTSAAKAASINSAIVRKRNRTPPRDGSNRSSNTAGSSSDICTIDSEAFQLNNHGGPILLPSAPMLIPQVVGVFGVDANKRINIWNDSAARVTGAGIPNTNEFSFEANSEEDGEGSSQADWEQHRRVIGMAMDDLFPSSDYTTGNVHAASEESRTRSSLIDVLDTVFRTGEPSMAVPFTKAGRKRGREKMSNYFAVDFLPQFASCPMFVSSRNVSGVVLVCKSTPRPNRNEQQQQLLDKPRSLSAASSNGTCPTETETEVDIDKEITETDEIGSSFHTCQIDGSYRTMAASNVVDSSFHSCQIDSSVRVDNAANIMKRNKRLEALEAFEDSSVGEDSTEENGIDQPIFANFPSPPLTERKAVVENGDEDYHALFETVDSLIFGVDTAGTINEWNYKMEALTGISRNDAIGRSLLEDTSLPFLPFDASMPDSRKRQSVSSSKTLRGEIEPVLRKAFSGTSTSKMNFRLKSCGSLDAPTNHVRNNQRYTSEQAVQLRHLVSSVSPRYNQDQEVIGALFLSSDLTEGFMFFTRKMTEAHELRKLIDTANAPIFGIDAHGYINEWNDKTAEITGYCKKDAFGRLLVDNFITPDIQNSVRTILSSALQHGEGASNYELEFKTKSNVTRHLLVNITPQHDMNNVVIGVILIAQDVTEAVERDRAVASMALELRQLIETANAPIFGIDIHGKVNEWNTRMSTITGFTKEEALDMPLVDNFIAPSIKEKVGEILEAALNGNETSNYEVEVDSKSGEPIVLLVNATTRRDPNSNVVGVVGVAQDVTEDRKHTRALRELETLKASQEAKVETERNMTAYFAHELRNPLGAIDSALAAMPDKLPETAQSLVSGMQLCTKFMSSIMNNLMDVRKMEEGKMRLGVAPVSIRKIMQNVHKMLSPSVRPGVEFRKLINVKGNDWVLGDAHRMEQVMTNVISNAIKYTISGHIQISIEWENKNLKFICEDTGPGIPKSEQAKLFQRFVQRGGAPGTGLGLAIAKHIVDLTGGSIRFESDPETKIGTTAIVLMALPTCKAPQSSVVAKKKDIIMDPISVLIIDDIKMNRTMVKRRILKGIAPNAKIQEAATGEEALLICGTDKFDVMIVDQFMEGAGGVIVGTDVVFAMRRMRIDSVLIGCSGNDIGDQFFDAGADMVWQKPMPSNDQIIRDLRSSLDKRGIALSCK